MRKIVFAIILLSALAATACGVKKHVLRTGPTVTPIPTVASSENVDPDPGKKEESFKLDLSDDEIIEVIQAAIMRMDEKYPDTREFDLSGEKDAETVKYGDGSSDVIVCDADGNETMRLMYDAKNVLSLAMLNEYENGKAVRGAQYQGSTLAKYFETADGNGKFYVEIRPGDSVKTAYVTVEKGLVMAYEFDKDGEFTKKYEKKEK